jgi:two-component system OmpR family sensor kinase
MFCGQTMLLRRFRLPASPMRSIRGRLTVWLALLIVLSMTGFAISLYAAITQTLIGNVDRALRVQGQQVASTYDFGAAESVDQSGQTGQHVDIGAIDQFATAGVFVETFDVNGRLLARSANLGRLHLPDESNAAALVRQPALISTQAAPGDSLRVYRLPVLQGNAPVGLVLVALSLHDVNQTTNSLLLSLLAGGSAVVLLVVLGASYLIRRGLRPLDEMAAVAQGITAQRLDQRLALHDAPLEVASLASTFNAMLERLHEAFAAQRRFVADASHDLRTPVATIQGRAEVLLLAPTLDADARAGLLMIRDEAARMGRMAANLLVLARGEEGLTLDKRRIELEALLLEVAGEARARAQGVSVAFLCHEPAVVMGDADLLRQALANLVDNAIEHTPGGGRIELSLDAQDGAARLTVRDTGTGIAPEYLPHIYERFYRVDAARSRERGGAGLGLSIVRQIAERHGGQVTVESVVGTGSVFTLILPLSGQMGEAQ